MEDFEYPDYYQQMISDYYQEHPTNSDNSWPKNHGSQISQPLSSSFPHFPYPENNVLPTQSLFQQVPHLQVQSEQCVFDGTIYPNHPQHQQTQFSYGSMEHIWPIQNQHYGFFQPGANMSDNFQLPMIEANVLGDRAMPNLDTYNLNCTQSSAPPLYHRDRVPWNALPPVAVESNPNMVTLNPFQQRCTIAKQRAKANWTAKSDEWSDKELLNYFFEAAPLSIRTKPRHQPLLPTPDDVEPTLDSSLFPNDVENLIRMLLDNGPG